MPAATGGNLLLGILGLRIDELQKDFDWRYPFLNLDVGMEICTVWY